MRSTRSVPLSISGDGAVRRIVKRNLSALLGLALLALVAAIAASLATWTVDDPSLSHATAREARNALGLPGAVVADLVMQFFGLAGIVLLLPPVVWSWRLVFGVPSRFGWWPCAAWIASVLSASLALATLPVFGTWPLPTGLGGVVGDLLLNLPGFLLGALPLGLTAAVLFVGFVILSAFLVARACGFSYERRVRRPKAPSVRPTARVVIAEEEVVLDEEDDCQSEEEDEAFDYAEQDGREPGQRGAVLFGALTHSALRIWSMVRRLSRRRLRYGDDVRVVPRLAPDYDDLPGGDWGDDAPAWQEPQFVDDDDVWVEPVAPVAARPAPQSKRPGRVTAPAPKPKPGRRAARETRKSPAETEAFELPPLDLLALPKASERKSSVNLGALEQNARLLEGVLEDFGVRGEIIKVRPGPVVTLYELEPAPGIKSARVIGLADDIARSMSAISCRVAVMPGKNAIGIELPNARRETVYLRELLASEDFETIQGQARAVPRQDHRRRAGDRRPRPHAASAGRRHHRLGQVGVDQRHDPVAALPDDAGPVPAHHDRPEDARTVDL